jgi:hypothetical protein
MLHPMLLLLLVVLGFMLQLVGGGGVEWGIQVPNSDCERS